MQTKRLTEENEQALAEAAYLLQHGEVVAFPTETVYGLGADATNEQAVAKIFKAKGRPSDNPLIVHVAGKEQLFALVRDVPPYVEKLIEAFSPGPITYVLNSNGTVTEKVTAGLMTVGVRIPDHPTANALLKQCQLPVAAPSANVSGKPSPTTAQHVLDDLDGKIAAVLDGGAANVGVESTVVDCTKETPVILRVGQITKEQIEQITGTAALAQNDSTTPKSPGMKYSHYMPEVPLYIVMNQEQMASAMKAEKSRGHKIGLLVAGERCEPYGADRFYHLGNDEQEVAAHLYDTLRKMHKEDVDVVFAQITASELFSGAVRDRLMRAATKIID